MNGPFERSGRPRHPDVLTPAEWDVLAYVRDGLSNAEAAAARNCSVETIRYHLRNLRAKTGISSRDSLRDWPGRPAFAIQAGASATRAWRIREQIPLIAVKDMTRMLAFYAGALGMQLVARYPEDAGPPGWCALAAGAARLMLHDGHHTRGMAGAKSGPPITLSLYVAGLDALHAELCARGERPGPITRMPYGARECYISDPESNELALVEFAASDPSYVTQPSAREPRT